MSFYLKLALALVAAGGVGGVWVMGRATEASRRRRLERTRRLGRRAKQSLADMAVISAGMGSSIRVIHDPRQLPAVSTSLVHLTLPRLTRTKLDVCMERTNTYFVVKGSGLALVEGEEVAIDAGDTIIFTPGNSYYIANSAWNGGDLELMWVSDPAAPREQLVSGGLVERWG
ncbi:unnamed protein product [Discosporangium mesarthrocarpum]